MLSSEIFNFKTIWGVSPAIQIALIAVLFVITIALSYSEYKKTGKISKYYPARVSLLLAPIYEEIIFRGFILILLTQVYSLVVSVVISSLLFGLWHLKNIFWVPKKELIYQLAYTVLIFGPAASILVVATNTIWLAVILHYANNILAPYSRRIFRLSSQA